MNRRAIFIALATVAGATAHAGSCRFETTGMAFGRYSALSVAGVARPEPSSDVQITVICTSLTRATPYELTLASNDGPAAMRRLRHGGGGPAMAAMLYRDAGMTQPWGDGQAGTLAIKGVMAPGNNQAVHTVWGRLPAGQQHLRPGAYQGGLTVTLNYQQ